MASVNILIELITKYLQQNNISMKTYIHFVNFNIHFVNVVYDLLRRKDQIPTVLILPVIIAHDVQFCLFFYVYYTH